MSWLLLALALPTVFIGGFCLGAILGRSSGYEEGVQYERQRIRTAALERAGELTADVQRILGDAAPATELEGWDRG